MYFNSRIQIAIFFNNMVERPDKVFYAFNEALGDVFDAQPVIIPLPPDAPVEIPAVQATSSNRNFTFNMSKLRADLILNNPNIDEEGNKRADKFYQLASKYIDYFASNNQIGRIGLISNTVVKNGNPIDVIKKRYITNQLASPAELSIRFNIRISKLSLIFNDITEVLSAPVMINGTVKNAIVVNKDINNVPEEGKTLSKKMLQDILDSFYPNILPDKVKELI